MHTSLGPGAQKLLRHKWRKLNAVSLHFRRVGENSCIVSWNESSSPVGDVSGWNLLKLHSCRNLWKRFAKQILTLKMLTLEVLVKIYLGSLASCLNELYCPRHVQVLYYFDDIKEFQCSVWGFFLSVFWISLLFWAVGFSSTVCWPLVMHFNF